MTAFPGTKKEALFELLELQNSIDSLKELSAGSSEHTSWVFRVARTIEEIFGTKTRYWTTFRTLTWSVRGTKMLPIYMSPEEGQQYVQNEAYRKDLETARGILLDAYSYLSKRTLDSVYVGSPVTMVGNINEEDKVMSDVNKKSVFVVHGRNHTAKKAIFSFLRSIKLEPMEWSEARALTGATSPYIGQILESGFQKAQAFIVLLTGDDQAKLNKVYLNDGDGPEEKQLTPQARQNVIFEAGMAFALHPERTLLIQFGNIRSFSDIAGRHIIKIFKDSTEDRQEIALRLRDAGCDIDITGTDWHTEGDFDSAINDIKNKREENSN